MSKLPCPLCGFEKLEKKVSTDAKGRITLGPTFTYTEVYHECPSCEWAADLSGETDKNYLKAKKKAEAQLVKNIIQELNEKGITMSFIERAFELPIRTLTRWKNSTSSAAGLALLRVIKTYPWISEVAAHKFNSVLAEKTLMQAAHIKFTTADQNFSHTMEFVMNSSSKELNYLPVTESFSTNQEVYTI